MFDVPGLCPLSWGAQFPPEAPAWVFRPLIPEKQSSTLPLAPRSPRPRDLGVESIYWTQRSGSSMENSDNT